MSISRALFAISVVFSLHLLLSNFVTSDPRFVKRESRVSNHLNSSGRKRQTSRIVGGTTAKPGEFPSIVLLWFTECSGIIVDKDWVLTAGSCGVEEDSTPSRNIMYAGKHDVEITGPHEQKVYASLVYTHEGYVVATARFHCINNVSVKHLESCIHTNLTTIEINAYSEGSGVNDISIMRVTPPFEFNEFVQPAVLPGLHDDPSGMSTVAGWGEQCPEEERGELRENKQNDCSDYTSELQKVDLPIITNEKCGQAYPNYILDTHICAGYDEGGKDTCSGDAGGPLYQRGENNETILVGIVSGGRGCAQPNSPGIYTRVSKFICWIKRVRVGLLGYGHNQQRAKGQRY